MSAWAAPALDPTWAAPARTALLVVDMQVDFALPEGAMGRAGADLSAVPAALAAAEGLVAAARAAGVPVLFAALQTTPESDSPAWAEWMRRHGLPPEAAAVCREGTPGAALAGPQPAPAEPVIAKRRYSAFFGTDLLARLRSMGRDTLVLCGLTTECCVDCTARDAFHHDLHVLIPADACAAYDAALHTGALGALAATCALITDTEALTAAWRPPSS